MNTEIAERRPRGDATHDAVVVVTPTMVNAGLKVLFESGIIEHRTGAEPEVVREIIAAAARAWAVSP